VIQLDASQGGGVADTAVVSAATTTPRGADWAPRSRACIIQGAPSVLRLKCGELI
jgi:hypothetical protein